MILLKKIFGVNATSEPFWFIKGQVKLLNLSGWGIFQKCFCKCTVYPRKGQSKNDRYCRSAILNHGSMESQSSFQRWPGIY